MSNREGCTDVSDGFVDGEGNLWLATSSRGVEEIAFSTLSDENNQELASCLIKIPADSVSLGDAEVTDLTTLAEAPAGGLIPLGNGEALIRVLDNEAIDGEIATIDDIRGQAVFGWAKLDLESLSLTPFDELPLSVAGTGYFLDGDDRIIAVTGADFENTTFYRLTDGNATPGISLPGLFINGN